MGVNEFSIWGFAAILNCDTMKVPFKYSGFANWELSHEGSFLGWCVG